MGKKHLILILFLVTHSNAGPLRDEPLIESANTLDVCTNKNVTYSRGDVVPDMAPCEICHCEPPNIICSMTKCQTNNGCKIIQQANRCCPEYKCDCEYEGKTYNNGEKMENPFDPCLVCYCRGGELMCTSVTCYHREDCEPQYVQGQCCPKYGHCPSSGGKIQNSTTQSSKREMQPWLLTKSVNVHSNDEAHYPQTIKIMEILPTQGSANPRPSEVSLIPRIALNEKNTAATDVSSEEPDLTTWNSTDYPKVSSEVIEETQELIEVGSSEETENSTDSSEVNTISDFDETTVSSVESKSDFFTKSGLSFPPVLKIGEKIQLKFSSGEKVSAPVQIGVYDPTRPDQASSIVTVVKEDTTESSDATSQILLTPDDLRTLAEMLIHEKIIPVNEPTEVFSESTTESENGTGTEYPTETVEVETTDSSVETTRNNTDWAQEVIDRITTNLMLPLQGIELIDSNETDSTPIEFNSTSSETTESEQSTRGSYRHIETTSEEPDLSRRVRVTTKEEDKAQTTALDEKDRMLVENFLKMNIDIK